MTTRAVLLGAGGHARVIYDILCESNEIEVAGCLSRGPARTGPEGLPVLGDDDVLPSLREAGITHAFPAAGDNRLRTRMLEYIHSSGFKLLNAISRHAVVSRSATVGSGVAIMPGAVVNAGAAIGDGVIVNTGATVDHDCTLESFCHVAPGCNLAGCVSVGSGAFLGTGTKVIPGIRIGRWAIAGAGAVVVRDVPDSVLVTGVPARIRRKGSEV